MAASASAAVDAVYRSHVILLRLLNIVGIGGGGLVSVVVAVAVAAAFLLNEIMTRWKRL